MKVIAKILDVSVRFYKKDGQPKEAADIVLKSGSTTIDATVFDAGVTAGDHLVYEKLTGQVCEVDLTPDVYRGNLQYRLGFVDPVPLTQPKIKVA